MYKKISACLADFGMNDDDIIMIFRESLLENWFIRGKTGEEIAGVV